MGAAAVTSKVSSVNHGAWRQEDKV